ncbi:MAG: (2Fe-2S)-binding protein [Hyphomonadaceae bacterium]|nr:(2Fe-2S)-binding protein [Hyphomonadaceae bacterium]
MAAKVINVDGADHTLDAAPDMPLLYALRDDLGLNNPKFGCGVAQCGACMVLIGGVPTFSCVTPLADVSGPITTIAGIGEPGALHPIQQAYIDEATPQCGYCISGWMLRAVALLKEIPRPTDNDIREAFAGLKCRCGTHMAIMRAVKRAAGLAP